MLRTTQRFNLTPQAPLCRLAIGRRNGRSSWLGSHKSTRTGLEQKDKHDICAASHFPTAHARRGRSAHSYLFAAARLRADVLLSGLADVVGDRYSPRALGAAVRRRMERMDCYRDDRGPRNLPSAKIDPAAARRDLLQAAVAGARGVSAVGQGNADRLQGGRHHVGLRAGDLTDRRRTVGLHVRNVRLFAEADGSRTVPRAEPVDAVENERKDSAVAR